MVIQEPSKPKKQEKSIFFGLHGNGTGAQDTKKLKKNVPLNSLVFFRGGPVEARSGITPVPTALSPKQD